MLEGETEEQENQETGESDGSCGKSEKLVCLGLNETKWGMWGLKSQLSLCQPVHPELLWERTDLALEQTRGTGDGLMQEGRRRFSSVRNDFYLL